MHPTPEHTITKTKKPVVIANTHIIMGLGHYPGEKLHQLRTVGQKFAHGVRVAGTKLGG
jgi:hypothetical protein